jgi:hypothetical protein
VKWPAGTAAAVTAALAIGATSFAIAAGSDARRAEALSFASDGYALWASGVRKAQVANSLLVGAAFAGAAGVIVHFTF